MFSKTWFLGALIVLMALLAAGAVSCGCGGDDDDDNDDGGLNSADDDAGGVQDYLNAIPDPASLALTLPGADYGDDDFQYKEIGQQAEYYTDTVQFTRDVNHDVLGFLSNIDDITSYDYTQPDPDTYVWGPWQDTGLDMEAMRFVMTRIADLTYDYKLQWRPKDSQDDADWVDIWFGHVVTDTDTARRGEGNFTVDFDAAAAIDFTVEQTGSIEVQYNTFADGRQITLNYINYFSTAENMAGPLNATYTYHNHADNTGEFEFDYFYDINWDDYQGAQYALFEHAWFNTRWTADGLGRTDVVVTDGDLPNIIIDGQGIDQYLASECWGNDFLRTYWSDGVVLADSTLYDSDPYITEGDQALCAPFDTAQLPAAN